jgi:squalene-hopene/tetraprenyl-beta-curcumene cyclase
VAAAQKPDGSVFANGMVVNYETSAAVGAFAQARMAKYGAVQAKARDYLAGSQIAGDESSPAYGGFPYMPGPIDKPVDLSNLQFAVEALRDAGVPSDHVVFQRALKYLARVQNRSESNPGSVTVKDGGETKEVVSSNDGGAVYAPGTSKAGLVKRADGKFEARSYGSMTYALLKCLLIAGAKPDDPRVVAAVGWLQNHFTLDRNPGFEEAQDPAKAGQQGYYYYLRTMSRALAEFERATGKPLAVKDRDGAPHAWRKEVVERVLSLQKPEGFWVNDKAERWDEGDPVLATSYALEALAIARGAR